VDRLTAACTGPNLVSGSALLVNKTNQQVTTSLTLALTQHIPPAVEGRPDFTPVPGETIVFDFIVIGPNSQIQVGFQFSTLAVDPRANSIRVESLDHNPAKSDSFPVCQ
jgi:hypothetical protein